MNSVHPFEAFLEDLQKATNESQKRHLFTNLAAVGFGETDFATELALTAEYQVKFREKGLLRRGAVDSFFGNLVIEFENDLGKSLEHALEQLQGYVAGAWQEDGSSERQYLAIATDGANWRVYIPTLERPGDTLEAENVWLTLSESWSTADGDATSLRDFLNRLFFRKTLQRPTADNFARDFGVMSPTFMGASGELWQKRSDLVDDPQFEVLRSAWSDSLQIAYGSVEAKDDLFIKHTYLAVLAKLLVWTALERRHMEGDDLEDVLTGKYFSASHVENMADDDFFRWYEIDSVTDARRAWIALSRQLAGYDLTEISEDVLKPLYEQLVDPETRHDLGEYYTPDWLAAIVTERLFDQWDWDTAPPTVLDPTCGSGTFLRAAIHGMRGRLTKGSSSNDLLRTVLASVVGMDVHPLAVIVAKATYLLAVKDLIPATTQPITLPVFLANSLLIPRVEKTASLWGDRVPLLINKTRYEVPPDFVTHGRDFDEGIGAVMEVARAYGSTKSPLEDIPASFRAVIGDQLVSYDESEELIEVLGAMAGHIARLIRGRRDSVHGFMLRNNYRPSMLRNSFDLVVGNPPWLTVSDIATADYKNLVVRLAAEAGIAPRSARDQAHTELATIFLWHVATQFLRLHTEDETSARVALVMPRSVLTATQHSLLREGKYRGRFDIKEIWDLDGVAPLFNVPACVLFASPSPARPSLLRDGRIYRGHLPSKDLPWTAAERLVSSEQAKYELVYLGKRSAWRPHDDEAVAAGLIGAAGNAYHNRFRQGAILYPNTLFIVVAEESVRKGMGSVRVRTNPDAAKTAQQLKGDRANEVVETDNLFTTAAAHHLLPYALASELWMVVLPTLTTPGDKGFEPVDADALRKAGRVGTASWLDWAEKRWATARKKDDELPLNQRIDHLRQLRAQGEMQRHVVLYTAQGNRPVSTYLDTKRLDLPFVARDQTYWASFGEEAQAHVLVALLNSEFAMSAIRDWMTRGLFGPRHIHKRVLDVPWPLFDKSDSPLVELAKVSRRLADQAAGIVGDGLPKMAGGRLRTWLREQLDSTDLMRVEQLVAVVSKGVHS